MWAVWLSASRQSRERSFRGGQERKGGGGGGGGKAGGSFTGQLTVEARQADGKGLQGTHGVVVVQSEDVLGHAAKLHDDVVG